MINWTVSNAENKLIVKIAKRAEKMADRAGGYYDPLVAMMDITAAHANGCPLDLQGLLEADDFNFSHDVFGIRRHINCETGKLEDCFLPRFAGKA